MFILVWLSLISFIFSKVLSPVFKSNEVIIEYGLKPFNIVSESPKVWFYLKKIFVATFIFSNIIYSNYIYSKLFVKFKNKKIKKQKYNIKTDKLNLLIGNDIKTGKNVYLPELGLYQNFLITGTIGTGKTSSAMYPFTEQLLKYNSENPDKKIGTLILDVKGNYYKQIKEYAKKYNLENDLVVIELGGKVKYNPLHKPNLKPGVLANRLKTIFYLFSENNSESYWIDKAEQVLCEAIKLCRIYNNGYVTFTELHKIITSQEYYKEKIEILKNLFMNNKLSNKQIYDLNSALEFFQKEYEKLDSRTLGILKSEISRITNVFVSDYDISKVFCSSKKELNFKGFKDVIANGKIVVLNMNISEYRNLSKIIAAYLKLDFQSEIMLNLSKNNVKPTAFICDEYAEYVTKTDSEFFSLSREARCINIVSTQSYSSLKNTLKDETAVKVICQNLINKIWFRTDDIFTIEEAQKQLGKEEKIKTSKNISESSKETRYSRMTNSMSSMDSTIQESFNVYTQNEYIYDTNFFTQKLETFKALTFLSDGNKILKPRKLDMFPYFLNNK